MESKKSRILVIGLGNPNLGDDGVGWRVAEEVRKQLSPDLSVDVDCLSLGGIGLRNISSAMNMWFWSMHSCWKDRSVRS